jgi:diguanylate cyclase (GGDEF)-like protein
LRKRVVEQGPAANGCPLGKECSLSEEIGLLRERCRKLEELSFIDALTGLYNFRYLLRSLEMEMERTRRAKLPTGLIMMDLDHFKNVNTIYGHECGNAVLTHFGKILKEGVRVIDVPCRYGGEEFALVLPGASLMQSVRIAERLREATHSTPVTFGDETFNITASFGVAVFSHTSESTAGAFLDRADRLLYEAKNTGRDRICAEKPVPISIVDEVTDSEKAALFSSTGESHED